MSVHDEGSVVFAKVSSSCYFNLNLPESLSESGTARVEIIVHVLDVEDDVLGQSLSAKDCFKLMLPVCFLINLKRLHCFDIHDMYKL